MIFYGLAANFAIKIVKNLFCSDVSPFEPPAESENTDLARQSALPKFYDRFFCGTRGFCAVF